jgi:hypothetical protein
MKPDLPLFFTFIGLVILAAWLLLHEPRKGGK